MINGVFTVEEFEELVALKDLLRAWADAYGPCLLCGHTTHTRQGYCWECDLEAQVGGGD